MTITAGRILKGAEAKVGGKIQLSAVAGSHREAGHFKKSPGSGNAQVNIIESNEHYSLIEVLCGCGEKMLLKCEYASLQQ